MLNRLIAWALENRLLVAVGGLFLAVYGIWTGLSMPIDVLPDLNRPTVTVISEAHGMAPEDVERLVTRPLELALAGSTGVTRLRSSSGLGISVVHVEFGWGAEIFRSRQVVQEKLQLAKAQLPPPIQPQMAPIASIMGQVQLIGILAREGSTDLSDLRAFVDQEIRPRLRSIPGVAQVVAIGGAPRQLQVSVDADRLRVFDVALEDVAEAVRAANVDAEGGIVEIGSQGPAVAVKGRVDGPARLAQAVVRADGARPVRVGDVAEVAFAPAVSRTGEAGVDAVPAVILTLFKQPDADTVALAGRVARELDGIRASLPPGVEIAADLFQQADFIRRAVGNVEMAVRDGVILVVAVLVLFLLNWRTTVITLTAIPLSVAMAALVFKGMGLTINTMTLGGLAVAVGALVDDAIVDVENVFRRLRENALRADPRPVLRVVFSASSEVRNPILIGTLLVVAAYLPLFFLSGIEGKLFTPIGLAYITTLLASLVVSLTVTPVLCYYLLGGSVRREHAADGWLVRRLKGLAERAIRASLAHTAPILGGLAALLVVSFLLLATQGTQFLPAFNEGSYQVNLVLPPGTSLGASDAYARRMERSIREVEGVLHVARRTGRAEGDEHAEGVHTTEAIVTIDPASPRSRQEILDEIRDRMAREFPGVASSVEQPLAHLLSHLLSGVNAQVAVKIQGPDLGVLRDLASDVESRLRPIPGVTDLFAEPQVMVDQVEIAPRRERLAVLGLRVEEVGHLVELALGGEEIGRYQVGQASYPIVVRLEEEDRRNLPALAGLDLKTAHGQRVRLGDAAAIRVVKTHNNINREDASRRVVVQHNVSGRSLGEVSADVEKALEPVRTRLAGLPGYSLRVSGQFEAQAASSRLIGALSLLALAAMFLILFVHYRSVQMSLQVLAAIPMAFVGAAFAVGLSGQTVSVATLVGLVSLGGIAARNAILLLDHYIHLMREEGEPFGEAMIVRAGQERMVPVLMTALCAGIALVPLVIAPDEPGREILHPVATVILWGLISSTLLEFLVTPGLFRAFAGKAAGRLAAEGRESEKGRE